MAVKLGSQRAGYWRIRKLVSEGWIEKRCYRCMEYWPEDADFYHRKNRGNGTFTFHGACKACVTERCYELKGGHGWKATNEKRRLQHANSQPDLSH